MLVLLIIIDNVISALGFLRRNQNLNRLLLFALINKHISRFTVRATEAPSIVAAAASLVRAGVLTEALLFKLFEIEGADSGVIELHPGISLGLWPVGVALTIGLCMATTGVDVRPVMTGVSCPGVYDHTYKFVLPTVLLCGPGIVFRLRLLLRLWLFIIRLWLLVEATFFAHDFIEGIRSKVEVVGELEV